MFKWHFNVLLRSLGALGSTSRTWNIGYMYVFHDDLFSLFDFGVLNSPTICSISLIINIHTLSFEFFYNFCIDQYIIHWKHFILIIMETIKFDLELHYKILHTICHICGCAAHINNPITLNVFVYSLFWIGF